MIEAGLSSQIGQQGSYLVFDMLLCKVIIALKAIAALFILSSYLRTWLQGPGFVMGIGWAI